MSRFFKKLSYKYDYLNLELEETQELSDEYQVEFNKLFGKYFIDKNSEMWVNEATGEIRKERPEKEEEKEVKPKKVPNKKLKELYKTLSKFVHPDKGGNTELFNKVKDSYENEDLFSLLKFAGDYELKYEYDEKDKELISSSIKRVEDKINTLQNTLAWHYCTGDKHKKITVIKMLEKQLNIEVKQEDIPKELHL